MSTLTQVTLEPCDCCGAKYSAIPPFIYTCPKCTEKGMIPDAYGNWLSTSPKL